MKILLLSLASLTLPACVYVLYKLWIIDLRVRLLPNRYVLAFTIFGLCFHSLSLFVFSSPIDLAIAAALGGGILYVIRLIANWHYKTDTLGLGDVKLMAGAGVWLGVDYILLALTIGAIAGVFHGLGAALYQWKKTGLSPDFGKLEVPAGPGFIFGIVICALAKFSALPHLLFS